MRRTPATVSQYFRRAHLCLSCPSLCGAAGAQLTLSTVQLTFSAAALQNDTPSLNALQDGEYKDLRATLQEDDAFLGAGSGSKSDGTVGEGELESEEKRRADRRVLFMCYSVLFSRYVIATFLSAFFPVYAEDNGISGTFSGLIFAAFPLGITLTSFIGSSRIKAWGVRTSVCIGMVNTAVFTLAFGMTPFFFKDPDVQKWFFLLFYFLGGLGGALAENACIILANYRFRENIGAVSASIGTVSGLGCMAGPPMGGVLYDYGGATGMAAFFFPFLVFSITPFLINLMVPCLLTREVVTAGGDQGISGKRMKLPTTCEVLTFPRTISLVAIAMNGAIVATLDPTLEYRLEDEPINYSASMTGLVFMASSIAYTLTSIPVGMSLDRNPANGCLFKSVQAFGFIMLAVCFIVLGPLDINGSDAAFNNIPSIWAAMVLKGIGSSGNNAGYPDLILGVADDDEGMHSKISALWNAAYAIGWALGPLAGGLLYEWIGFRGYASVCALLAVAMAAVLFITSNPCGEHVASLDDDYDSVSVDSRYSQSSRQSSISHGERVYHQVAGGGNA